MSASSKRPTYCLIYWALEKTYSIGETKYISNAEMLYDPATIGAILHVGKATEKPQTGWPTYPGSVLFLSGKVFQMLSLSFSNFDVTRSCR
jgi:hypothetical protein